jgi:membrane protein
LPSWLPTIVNVFRVSAVKFSDDGSSYLAQAVAFNALFAAIPLSLVIVAMFGYIYGSDTGSVHALATIHRFAPQLDALVATSLPAIVQYRGISGLVGLGALIWSAKNVFGALTYGLDRSLGVPGRSFLIETLIAVVLVPVAGIALIVATVVPVIVTYVVRFAGLAYLRVIPQIGSYAFSLGFIFVASALIYAYLPNRASRFAFGVPGALVAAIGYSVAQVGFGIYTAHANFQHLYGTLSAIFVVMLWIYFVALIFLFGAHVSAQWEEQTVGS